MRARATFLASAIALATAIVLLVAPAILPPRVWPLTGVHRWLGLCLVGGVALALVGRRVSGPLIPAKPSDRRVGWSGVLLVVGMPVYVLASSSGWSHTSGDNTATRLLGLLIVREGTIDLSRLPEYQGEPLHYSAVRIGEKVLPTYPLGTGLLSVPYAALALAAAGDEWRPRFVNRWERHLSALLAAAATVFLFLAVREVAGEHAGFGAAVVFAFGTTAFSSMSQALWSTTGEVFLICLALWMALPDRASPRRCLAAGVLMGGAFLCRPTATIAAGALGMVLLLRRRTDFAWYGAAALTSTVLAVMVLFRLYGHPLGGYGLMHRTTWGHNTVEGLLGTLLSPSRGLLPFCPYLLLLPAAWRQLTPTSALRRALLGAFAGVASYYLLVSLFDHWTGGWSIGPRLLTEAAPFIAILTVPAWLLLPRRRWWRLPFLLAVAFAAATQLLSVYSDRAERANFRLTDSAAFWSLRGSQLAAIWCLPCPERGEQPDALDERAP